MPVPPGRVVTCYKKPSIKQLLENTLAGQGVAMGKQFDGNPSSSVELANIRQRKPGPFQGRPSLANGDRVESGFTI